MTEKKLKVAVVGCGRISICHLAAIHKSQLAELTACCDIKFDRAEEAAKKFGGKAYSSYEKMLENEQIDAVHLCLPHYLHIPYAVKAFEYGISVLSEKPMGVDYESAEHAVSIAKEKQVNYGVIFQCRYNASTQAVKRALESGKLGKIICARSVLTWSRPDEYYSESDWKGTWDKEGGGVVIDQAIHSIDIVNWLVNSEVESMQCSMFNRGHNAVKVEDTAEGLITYKNGVKYAFYCMNNYGCDEPIEIKLLCEKGKVTFDYDDALIEYNDGTIERVDKNTDLSHCLGPKYWGVKHDWQIEQFYKACLELEPLEISGEEALKTHKLIMDLYTLGGMKPKRTNEEF